jgi:hypothetical protein
MNNIDLIIYAIFTHFLDVLDVQTFFAASNSVNFNQDTHINNVIEVAITGCMLYWRFKLNGKTVVFELPTRKLDKNLRRGPALPEIQFSITCLSI